MVRCLLALQTLYYMTLNGDWGVVTPTTALIRIGVVATAFVRGINQCPVAAALARLDAFQVHQVERA